MIIGSGWEQAPLVKAAKDLGYFILATHSTDDAEGFQYADATEILDPRDINKAMHLFKKYDMEAVTSDNDDYALYTVGVISNKFGLPGPNLDAVSYSNNKRRSRIACEKAAVKQPPFYICENLEDLHEGVAAVGGYPVIVKPVDNRGNFGINRVENESQLEDAFYDAISNSHSKEFLVEKFIEGTLVTVDGFSFDKDNHFSLAVASKQMLGGHRRVAIDIVYPGEFDEETIRKLLSNNDKVAKALSYDFGFTHSEYILDDEGEVWLVESTNRGGGVYTSSLIVPGVTELDLKKHLIESAFGNFNVPDIDALNPMKNAALLSFFKFDNGKIKKVHGLDEAGSLPGVLKCNLAIKEGDIIEDITTDANRHGYMVILGENKDTVRAKERLIKDLVKLEYE